MPPFGARAVVADDVEDQRVVQLAQVLDGLDQAADLMVGVLAEAGEDLHLAGEELLLVVRVSCPNPGSCGWARLGSRRTIPSLLLPGQGFFAHLVPAPRRTCRLNWRSTLGDVVRRVRCARGEIDEERLVGRQGLLHAHPVDGLVGHVGHEVVVRVVGRLDPGSCRRKAPGTTGSCRRRGTRRTCQSRTGRPAVEGPGRPRSQVGVSWHLPKAAVL